MADFPEALVREVFSSAFVDENLFIQWLGGSKSDPGAIKRYLSLPLAFRPEVSPFFDREFYWQIYPDIRAVDIDPLVHFMKWGVGEERSPHPLIDVKYILLMNPGLLTEPPTIDTLHQVLCQDHTDPSPLFSLGFYRQQIDNHDEVEGGLLRHFLQTGLLRGFRPNSGFDPIPYYRAIETKTYDIRCCLRHFALSKNASQECERTTEGQAKASFRAKSEAMQLFRRRNPLQFDFSGRPELSVIMVVHNNIALTLQTLASLRSSHPRPIELILVDSGSTDETRHLAQYLSGACLLQFDSNIGFVRGCNAGLAIASADAVLYINNDVELAEGAISAAMRRLQSDASIGAVGAKVIRTHGLLQEAGGIIWRDGWTVGYQRGQSPLSPEVNFVRDVAFCSAVFLLVRTSVLKELGGFDHAFAPAYFEDADLCMRIQEAGYRIVYDPAITVYHLEYGSLPAASEAHQRIQEAHPVFVRKHAKALQLHYESGIRAQLFARAVNQPRGRVLLIDDQLPLRRLGSGFVRSNDIVGIIAGLGYQVTVYPICPNDQNLASVYADFPDTVEVMHDRGQEDLEQFLMIRRGYYSTIWIARSHNLDLVKPIVERCGTDVVGVRMVLDTEAIGATREGQRRGLSSLLAPFDVQQAIRKELRNAFFCRTVLAVSAHEMELLQALGLQDVRVLGHLRPLSLTPSAWAQRAGMLFVGAMHGTGSPNFDSLCWFVDEVLPLIEQQLGYETRLTVAGFATGEVDLARFQDHARITLRGAIVNTAPLYDAHRVFVAPTRYAAGLPYKVHEAASYGVPVAATEVLRRQLEWVNGRDLLSADAADPAAFAENVLALYRSEMLWNDIRAGAAERIRTECGREVFEQTVAEILR
jgi:O-antigen biosynthesis protein